MTVGATAAVYIPARNQDCQNEEADRSSAPSSPLPLEVGPGLKSS